MGGRALSTAADKASHHLLKCQVLIRYEIRTAAAILANMATTTTPTEISAQIAGLRDVGRGFYARGWSVGTSSNYSVVTRRDPLELLVTASGKDKGRLSVDDFVRVGGDGQPTIDGQPKASAETMLHVALAADPAIGCVLHTHSVWATLLSDIYFDQDELSIDGYEMLKGLDGIQNHTTSVRIRIFDNTQEIPQLAKQVTSERAAGHAALDYAFLMRRHGLYTWGRDLDSARRHVEVLEFLFEVLVRRLNLRHPNGHPPQPSVL